MSATDQGRTSTEPEERPIATEPPGATEPPIATEPPAAEAETPDTTGETGAAEAGAAEAGVDATETDVDAAAPPSRLPIRRWLALGAAIVLLTGVGTAFELKAHQLRSEPAAANHALTDTSETTEVIGQVDTALAKVLSYDYANPTATQQAAEQLLTGDAASQYRTLFTALQAKAPGEKLTLTARVVTAAVTSLQHGNAQLLVFLDQSSTRASDKQSSTSAAQLQVTAVRTGAGWKISELLPL